MVRYRGYKDTYFVEDKKFFRWVILRQQLQRPQLQRRQQRPPPLQLLLQQQLSRTKLLLALTKGKCHLLVFTCTQTPIQKSVMLFFPKCQKFTFFDGPVSCHVSRFDKLVLLKCSTIRAPGGQYNQTGGGPGDQPGSEFGPPRGGPNQDGYNFYPNSQQSAPDGQQPGQYSGPFPHPPYPNHTVNPGYNRVPTDTVRYFTNPVIQIFTLLIIGAKLLNS